MLSQIRLDQGIVNKLKRNFEQKLKFDKTKMLYKGYKKHDFTILKAK